MTGNPLANKNNDNGFFSCICGICAVHFSCFIPPPVNRPSPTHPRTYENSSLPQQNAAPSSYRTGHGFFHHCQRTKQHPHAWGKLEMPKEQEDDQESAVAAKYLVGAGYRGV